ncbi:TetR/AcrR family transcriptional regulator [Niallia nealsonii]|uniref:TetR family transcriptional regulator n=1 Tax=Niallia nealsonii TaxID=115979 RepID=A0A2N0Z5L1_9BACI|nr:TetR/AcrR family transcriptional regulator [Niallia nealsonii]PKG24777.1 TetR family transcriptional regulator [Niallia nealsonii]
MMKKQLIMEKALELFAMQGFEATSVQQITEQCGISKGAFYLSFKSKDELILSLIDHFMMQITSELDCIVRDTEKTNEVLYKFYYGNFSSFYKYSDFAKTFIKEQTHSFNEEFILKIHYYDSELEKIILSMIERIYGENLPAKLDIMYSIKGFMNTYSHLFLFSQVPFDLHQLAKSLVEKTDLLAKHAAVPFLTEELYQNIKHPVTEEEQKEKILEIIDQKIEGLKDDSIVQESFILLKKHLKEPTFGPAIVKGLLENIRHNSHCKWITYLLQSYLKM